MVAGGEDPPIDEVRGDLLAFLSSSPPSSAKSDDATDAEHEAALDASEGTDVLAASGLKRSILPKFDSPTSTLEKLSPRRSAAAVSLRIWGTTCE